MTFTVSEPWEFEDENPGPELTGIVDAVSDTKMLLRVEKAFSVEKETYEFLLCELRHEGGSIDELVGGNDVPCNGLCVPNALVEEAKGLNSAWWRGGGGLVGSIRKA